MKEPIDALHHNTSKNCLDPVSKCKYDHPLKNSPQCQRHTFVRLNKGGGNHKLRRQYFEDFFAPSSLAEKLFHKLLKQFRWYLATPPSPMLVCVVHEWLHNRIHTITRGHNQHSSHGNWFSYTLRLKSHWPFASVCYKTTLNTGGEGGTGEDHQTLKIRTSFLMSLAFGIPILNNFQKRSFWSGTLKQKFPLLL